MSDDAARSGGPDRPRKRRRRRRRKPGEGDAGGEARPAPPRAEGSSPAPERSEGGGRQRRRRRGRPTGGEPGRERRPRRERAAETDAPRERERAPAPAPPADVDAGWDDDAPAVATARPEVDDDDDRDLIDESVPYGDDTDAPTPDITLAADMPVEDAADPDPSTSIDDGDAEPPGRVRNVVGVKFQNAGKIYSYDAGDDSYQRGEEVMVQSDRGPRIGVVAVGSERRPYERGGLKKILRRPDRNDRRALERNQGREQAALARAREVARALQLPIKVFRVELAHSGKKARVYFTSEDRIDFRELVRELGTALHVRVEMRQTGVRDQAKLVGGIGSCGAELCCSTWLPEFVPVSIKNAKDQGLVLNPTKVSGQCGRLKCCLVYEQALYAELRKGLPKLGKRVVTEIGEGRVVEVDVLRQRVRVSHVTGDVEVFTADQVRPLFPSQKPNPRKKDPDA